MLGEPLYENETGQLSEMQTQTPGGALPRSSSGEGAASIASSSSGAFVEAALGTDISNGPAQHAQHAERALNTDTLACNMESVPTGSSQHAQQAARPNSNSDPILRSDCSADDSSPSSNQTQPPNHPAEPAGTSEASHHARNMADCYRQAAPGVAASSIADRGEEQDREGGGRPWLKRAFSMVECENLNVDYDSMNSLDKVA